MNAEPYRPPRRADYIPNVRAILPGASPAEMDARADLLLMRVQAAAAKPYASTPAFALLDIVEVLAGKFALRPMAFPTVLELRGLLADCASLASAFNLFFSPALPIEGEAANG